ncbi:NAD(P)-dependent dehydrogenase, short-chain alcohol dehydrogenase family [Cyclobacterium lianum]|uniref:NAD(P)-dependent dehydrogenase, short-chain alcohol dehydrogenase family n=1 Tax=Cyclobacterium lianum TaxID=388280 RepID=A0A1M7JKZ4_9BACT|nr:SDR family oxidoreductase [Cyclobacterium lianum]SHM53605.1 NAD(P)-dependent dehydrogenase, short-chain alcohol dehydrogenase family [Cyclobacterium lianum]
MKKSNSFSPRVIVITGASRGIGKAMVEKYAENGDLIALVADQKVELEETVAAVKKGDNCLLLHGDLANSEFLKQVVQNTLEKWGRIDVLINNAAWRTVETLRTITLENWEKTIKICLTAPVFLSRLVAESMEKVGSPGVIIQVSSIMATRAGGTSPAYVASKGALLSITYEMAALYGPSGIRVIAVCPGNVHTSLSQDFTDCEGKNISGNLVRDMENQTPLQRSASPEEIANGVYWLSSKEASFVTGTALVMDGGFTHNFSSYKNKHLQFPKEF